jgi:Lar family restriction alleviation protein
MKKYYCSDCGIELDEGEGSVFTCCEVCWNKHYKKADEQSEVRVELPVIVQGELLPCPFCGNKKVKVVEYEALGMWRCIECKTCKGQFYFFNKHTNIGVGRGTTQQRKQRIIDAWNKRAGREPKSE